MMSRRIILISNDSTGEYPANRLNAFTNVLPSELPVRRRKRTSVALETLSFSARFVTTPDFITGVHPSFVAIHGPNRNVRRILLRPQFHTTDSLVESLNDQFAGIDVTWWTRSGVIGVDVGLGVHFMARADTVGWLNLDEAGFAAKSQNGEYFICSKGCSIGGTAPVALSVRRPKYVRVDLPDLHHTIGSRKLAKTLAIIPCISRRELSAGNVFHFEVTRHEPCQLDLTELRSLRLELTDEDGKLLQLDAGQPTVVQLRLGKMPSSASRMLRLSTRDPGASGHNADCRFTLHVPLDLEGDHGDDWEVALTSLQYPARFQPYQRNRGAQHDFGIRIGVGGEWEYADLSADGLKGLKAVVREMYLFTSRKTANQVELDEADDRIKFIVNPIVGENVYFALSHHLAVVLGAVDSAHAAEADEEEGNAGMTVLTLVPDTTYTFSFKMDAKRLNPSQMFVYSDMVRPSVLGSRYAPILKFVPIMSKNDNREMISYESEHLDFITFSRAHIETIHMRLVESDGGTIAFKNKQEEVLYNFLLRRKM